MPEPSVMVVTHSVSSLAKYLSVSEDKILNWIRSGELSAINVATSRCGRPRWRITLVAWNEFQASRTKPAKSERRLRAKANTVIEFF